MSFLFLDLKVWKIIRSGEEVEYRRKSHFKNFSATRQSKMALKQYFYTKKKFLLLEVFANASKLIPNSSKKDIKMFLSFYSWNYSYIFIKAGFLVRISSLQIHVV